MHLVVDRYLRGSLSEEELSEFEERLVWDQDLMEDLELAERLRNGLRAELEKTEESIPEKRDTFWQVSRFLTKPAYAAAASFMLAVGLTSTFTLGPVATDRTQPGGEPALTRILPLYATRSDNATAVPIDAASWTVLLVDAPPGYDSFRVSVNIVDSGDVDGPPGYDSFPVSVNIADSGDDSIWSQENLVPTYPDSLAIGMPGRLLPSGSYLLVLEGRQGDAGFQTIQRIPFRSIVEE